MRLATVTMQRLACVAALCASSAADARMSLSTEPFATLFTPISFVSPANFAQSVIDDAKRDQMVKALCAEINAQYKRLQLKDDACGKVAWKAGLSSKSGKPLIYAEFGKGEETTLLLGGVHPDELTPIPIAFRVARHLSEHPDVLGPNVRVIVAPLVNPDGFLKPTPSRTNLNGIDLNRNFFTMDWYDKARKLWVDRRARVGAHFPGYFPNSEIETLFQVQLIDQYKPDKILSIHAPLGFLDYDGPGDGQPMKLSETEQKAKRLVTSIAEKSKNYKVVDYNFYPGSLGNYAGQERHIPTVTLELETTEVGKVDVYWQQFLPGIMQSIHYPFQSRPDLGSQEQGNASPFSAQYLGGRKRTI